MSNRVNHAGITTLVLTVFWGALIFLGIRLVGTTPRAEAPLAAQFPVPAPVAQATASPEAPRVTPTPVIVTPTPVVVTPTPVVVAPRPTPIVVKPRKRKHREEATEDLDLLPPAAPRVKSQ